MSSLINNDIGESSPFMVWDSTGQPDFTLSIHFLSFNTDLLFTLLSPSPAMAQTSV